MLPDEERGQPSPSGTSGRTSNRAGSTDAPPRRPRSRLRSIIVRNARFVTLILLGFLAVLYMIQDRMIFPGAATQGRPEAAVHPRPGSELITLTTSGGERVVALYGPALSPDGRPHPDPMSRPALLYFYGNAMCLAYAEPEFDRFRRLGLNVMIPDFLGYGLSSGKASEHGCQETAQAGYRGALRSRISHFANPRRRLVAGRGRRDRPGLAAASRRADRLQHVYQHARHGDVNRPAPPPAFLLCPQIRQFAEDPDHHLPDPAGARQARYFGAFPDVRADGRRSAVASDDSGHRRSGT